MSHFSCSGYNNQGCGSTSFTPVEGASTAIGGVMHRIVLCDRGHRMGIPILGPSCPNCGHQEPVRAGGDQHVPQGAAPTQVRAHQGGSSRGTMNNIAKSLGLGGCT